MILRKLKVWHVGRTKKLLELDCIIGTHQKPLLQPLHLSIIYSLQLQNVPEWNCRKLMGILFRSIEAPCAIAANGLLVLLRPRRIYGGREPLLW